MKMFFAKPIDEENPAVLFHWYPGQTNPQHSMISVDIRDGEVTARYNPEIGNAVTEAEFNGEWLMFELDDVPTACAANSLIDEVVLSLNNLLKENSWSVGNFKPHGEAVQLLVEDVRQVLDNARYNSINHVDCDKSEPLSIFDEYGSFIDTVYDE